VPGQASEPVQQSAPPRAVQVCGGSQVWVTVSHVSGDWQSVLSQHVPVWAPSEQHTSPGPMGQSSGQFQQVSPGSQLSSGHFGGGEQSSREAQHTEPEGQPEPALGEEHTWPEGQHW
jgi:hypothetical protein